VITLKKYTGSPIKKWKEN